MVSEGDFLRNLRRGIAANGSLTGRYVTKTYLNCKDGLRKSVGQTEIR
jgi:hypothetical protein